MPERWFQSSFLEVDRLVISQEALLGHDLQKVREVVERRNPWRERPKGHGLFAFADDSQMVLVFNPATWRVIQKDPGEARWYSAGLIMSPSAATDEALLILGDMIGSVAGRLRKSAPLFVFEEKEGSASVDFWVRMEILAEQGLVQRDVFPGLLPDFLVWQARQEKKRARKAPVDLTKREPGWRYGWIRRVWGQTVSDYEKQGYQVIRSGKSVMLARLKSSTNPPEDISRLASGFGLEVRAPCGCEWAVDLSGSWLRERRCGDQQCDGFAHVEFRPETAAQKDKIYFLGEAVLGSCCWRCGSSLHQVIFRSGKQKNLVGITIEINCPHDGNISLERKWVRPDQILISQQSL